MPEATDLFVFFAWILGGFVSGVSGIGGAMVAFPLLALVIPVHQLIALTCIINVVMDGCLAGMHFRHCRLSSLWPMLAGSVPGSFAGLYILQICSGAVLQGAVGLLLLYYVYWQMTYRAAQGPVSHPQMLGAAAGFGAGLLGIHNLTIISPSLSESPAFTIVSTSSLFTSAFIMLNCFNTPSSICFL